MKRTTVAKGYLGPSPPKHIARVSVGAPFRWLKKGIRDLLLIPSFSLAYGALFSGMTYGALKFLESGPRSAMDYLAGFVFIAPFLAAGLYAASRDLQDGKFPHIRSSIGPVWQRKAFLTLYALMLAAIVLGFIHLTFALTAGYASYFPQGVSTETISELIATPIGFIAVVVLTILTIVTINMTECAFIAHI